MINFIGLTGKAGSGKSTAADMIKVQHSNGVGVLIIPFAKRLKEMAKLAGWDGLKDEKGRKFLQDFGELFRRYDDSYWVREWQLEVDRQIQEERYYRGLSAPKDWMVIVDDVRYDNEAEEINWLGGKIYRVVGRGGLPNELGNHESEMGISPEILSGLIDNSGTFADLAREVESVVTTTL